MSAAVGSEDHRHSLPTSKVADTMLFFGCRSQNADFFFRDEWQSLVAQNCLTLHTAFSRDQVSPLHCTLPQISAQAHPLCVQAHKVYVQHKVEEAGEQVWDWMHSRGAHVFIAG